MNAFCVLFADNYGYDNTEITDNDFEEMNEFLELEALKDEEIT